MLNMPFKYFIIPWGENHEITIYIIENKNKGVVSDIKEDNLSSKK